MPLFKKKKETATIYRASLSFIKNTDFIRYKNKEVKPKTEMVVSSNESRLQLKIRSLIRKMEEENRVLIGIKFLDKEWWYDFIYIIYVNNNIGSCY